MLHSCFATQKVSLFNTSSPFSVKKNTKFWHLSHLSNFCFGFFTVRENRPWKKLQFNKLKDEKVLQIKDEKKIVTIYRRRKNAPKTRLLYWKIISFSLEFSNTWNICTLIKKKEKCKRGYIRRFSFSFSLEETQIHWKCIFFFSFSFLEMWRAPKRGKTSEKFEVMFINVRGKKIGWIARKFI